jgi:Peptidase C13 family
MRAVLDETWHLLQTSLRALTFVPVRNAPVGARRPTIFGLLLLALLAQAAGEWFTYDGERTFNLDGVGSALATWAVFAVFVATLRRASRPFSVGLVVALSAGIMLWLSVAITLGGAIGTAFGWTSDAAFDAITTPGAIALAVLAVGSLVIGYWRIGLMATRGMPRSLGLSLVIVSILPFLVVPIKPMIGSENPLADFPTIWNAAELFKSWWPTTAEQSDEPAIDVEAAWDRQPDLVAKAIAGLTPARPGIGEVYFVGMAAYSEQDVFLKEARSAQAIIENRFNAKGRSVLLANHRDTLTDVALASATNLDKILAGIGRMMDVENDVLVLFVTSHGTNGVIAVSMPGFGLNNLTPDRLAIALAQSGIKNRVVILSACHAGSFLPALDDPDTLALTAAHADKTSFGCSHEREWTYFGDALFNQALRKTRSFPEAFGMARDTIAGLEAKDKLTPSDPQMSVGSNILAPLDAIQKRLDAAPNQDTAAPASRP